MLVVGGSIAACDWTKRLETENFNFYFTDKKHIMSMSNEINNTKLKNEYV